MYYKVANFKIKEKVTINSMKKCDSSCTEYKGNGVSPVSLEEIVLQNAVENVSTNF